MKNVLIAMLVILCATSAFSATKFLAGGGTTVNMYNTDNTFKVDARPTMTFGVGVGGGDLFGGLTPDEVYFIGQYSRGKVSDTTIASVESEEFISTYTLALAGFWYIADSAKALQPFFVLKTNVENQRAIDENLTYWTGQFGLGVKYPISHRTDVWGTGTVKMGAVINTDISAGLLFNF
jgi:hypothetical protein